MHLSRGTSSQHNQKSLCNLARPESDKKRPGSELVTNLWWLAVLFPHRARPAPRKSHGERVCVGFYLSRSSGNRPQVSERALDLHYYEDIRIYLSVRAAWDFMWRFEIFYIYIYIAPMNWLGIILYLNAAISELRGPFVYNFTSRAAGNRLVEPSAGGVSKMLPPFF